MQNTRLNSPKPRPACAGAGVVRGVWVALLCLSMAVASGCGKGQGDLKGSVSLDGKKLAMGQVWVLGSDSMSYYGVIADDGSYVVKGIPTGTCKIAVSSGNPGETGGGRDGKGREREPGDKLPGDPKKWFPIPDAYNLHATSQLTFDIKGGENVFDIKLTKK